MLPRFEVFHHSTARPRQVIVRQMEAGEFQVAAGATLGGLPVAPVLAQPRALDELGQPRLDLFVFQFIGSSPPSQLSEGQVVFLEVPNRRCQSCGAEWTEPELAQLDLEELHQLLVNDSRITFVRRLRELTGLGLSSAKAILDHVDFHPEHCQHCDARIPAGFRIVCTACRAITYPWHSTGVVVPPRPVVAGASDVESAG